MLLPQQRTEASSRGINKNVTAQLWRLISRSGEVKKGQNGLEVTTLQWAELPCRHSSLVRQLPSCHVLSSTCVERNSLRCADELSRRPVAAGEKSFAHVLWFFSRSSFIGGAQAVGSSSSSVMPPIAGLATARADNGLGGAEYCQDLHFP